MSRDITLTENNKIKYLTINMLDNKVNVLTSTLMNQLQAIFTDLATQDLKALVIASNKPGIFIAGADINEIKDITDDQDAATKARQGQAVLDQLSLLPFPTIAAIQGACLGGGCELALACDYRVASESSLIGLPEVNLGIIPGFGGTQRLPKLIGLQRALPLILKGKSVKAKQAYHLCLVDDYLSDVFFDSQLDVFVQRVFDSKEVKLIQKRRRLKGIARFLEASFIGRLIIFYQAKKTVMKATKGHYPAPLQALKSVRHGFSRSLRKGLLREAKLFSSLAVSRLSKNLIQLFFINESLKKYDGDIAEDVSIKLLNSCGVLGAGLMGGGIAWLISSQNRSVRLKDIQWDAIRQGYNESRKIYDGLRNRKRLKSFECDLKMLQLSGGLDYVGFDKVDVVIEAIIEDIDVKKTVFQELEGQVGDDTIIASNTSALSITEMASDLRCPERFIGMHFFSPVHRMPLVEIIPGQKTSPETIKSMVVFAKQLKKTPIVVQDCPGFLVNRILIPYVNEAVYCLQDGLSVEQIDTVMTDFGMPLGPLALADEVGLDVGSKVAKILEVGYGSRMKVSPLFDVFCNQMGLLGKKEGEGFYVHKGKNKVVNLDVTVAIQPYVNLKKDLMGKNDCLDRLLLIMLNEAARCLDEGVVASPELLDMAMVMGTGFPPFRGGLCRYIDEQGVATILERLSFFEDQLGERFSPSAALKELAHSNNTYYI